MVSLDPKPRIDPKPIMSKISDNDFVAYAGSCGPGIPVFHVIATI